MNEISKRWSKLYGSTYGALGKVFIEHPNIYLSTEHIENKLNHLPRNKIQHMLCVLYHKGELQRLSNDAAYDISFWKRTSS